MHAGIDRAQRRPRIAHVETEPCHGRLDRDRVRLGEQGRDQRQQPQLQLERTGGIAGEPARDHVVRGTWHHVRHHADHAAAAQREQRYHLVVVAAPEAQPPVREAGQLRALRDVAARLLHTDHTLIVRHLHDCGGQDVYGGAAGHVVDDAGEVARIDYVAEVIDQRPLRRPAVGRRTDENAVRAGCARVCGEQRDVASVTAAAADDHRDPCRGFVHDGLDRRALFVGRHCRGLAGRAVDDQRIGAGVDLEAHQLAQDVRGDAVRMERRDQRDAAAVECRVCHGQSRSRSRISPGRTSPGPSSGFVSRSVVSWKSCSASSPAAATA